MSRWAWESEPSSPSVPIRNAFEGVGTIGAGASAIAGGRALRVNALNRLDEAGAEQRNQHEIDAVQAAEDSAVTAADDGFALAE